MFAPRYFAPRYFADRYFPPNGAPFLFILGDICLDGIDARQVSLGGIDSRLVALAATWVIDSNLKAIDARLVELSGEITAC